MAVHEYSMGRRARRRSSACQLPAAPREPALPRGDPAHVPLHGDRRAGADRPGQWRRRSRSPPVPGPRTAPDGVLASHDGDAGLHRPHLADDVPPAARGPELSPQPGGHRAPAVDLLADLGAAEPRAGRDLAVDALRDADRPRRPGRPPHGALRGRADRRGQPLAGHPVRDEPAGLALHHGGDHPAGHRRAEDLRHHLRDDAGGPGTATETLNIFLYLQAFAFFNIGFASAVVVGTS